MIQNYKCNEIKIKYSEFSHTINATFLKIRSAPSHAFIAKCFRSEISLDRLLPLLSEQQKVKPEIQRVEKPDHKWTQCCIALVPSRKKVRPEI